MKALVSFLLLTILVASGCRNRSTLSLPYFNNADFTPVWLNNGDPGLKKLHVIPPFSFTDQNGRTITGKNTAHKIYVANFFFTRCGNICPRMMDNMKKVSNAFKGDNNVMIISHSVTPTYDNTAVLKRYAADKHITNPNWHLVTGNRDEIYKVARSGYFADAVSSPAVTSQFLHTENFILVDKRRHIRGVYNGTIELEMDNLVKHIKILEQEDGAF